MKKLIVTADDYGMSRGVNDAIEEGMAKGLITTTNVMTNMDLYEEAALLKDKFPNVSVGLHWVLSCGKPCTDPSLIPSLVDPDTLCFYKYSEFRKLYRKGKISNDEIKTELKAQYDRFAASVGTPDYWNTHQNVHVDFGLFNLFTEFAMELGIKKMRSHERLYVSPKNAKSSMSILWRIIEPFKASLLHNWIKKAHRKYSMLSPDGLVVCLNASDSTDSNYTFSNIQWENSDVAEFVIHPSKCIDSPYFGTVSDKRIDEYKQFTSDETAEIISKAEIILSSFSCLDN